MEKEKFFKCPYCLEKISMILDLSEEGGQTYVEDCEVCCNPILVSYEVHDEKMSNFAAQRNQ